MNELESPVLLVFFGIILGVILMEVGYNSGNNVIIDFHALDTVCGQIYGENHVFVDNTGLVQTQFICTLNKTKEKAIESVEESLMVLQ